MPLKGSEKFVAESLKSYFSRTNSSPSYREGENPPDIYLTLDEGEVAVEISDLNENTIKKNTGTVAGYLSFFKELQSEFSDQVPDNMILMITFYHFDTKVNKIKKGFKNYLSDLVSNLEVGKDYEECIDEKICFKVSVLESSSQKKIQGMVTSYGMFHKKSRDVNAVTKLIGNFDIEANTQNLIEERITTKTKKCRDIPQPIWLALNDRYFRIYTNFENNDHLDHYRVIFDKIKDFGIFERIFIIFENGDVLEKPAELTKA